MFSELFVFLNSTFVSFLLPKLIHIGLLLECISNDLKSAFENIQLLESFKARKFREFVDHIQISVLQVLPKYSLLIVKGNKIGKRKRKGTLYV